MCDQANQVIFYVIATALLCIGIYCAYRFDRGCPLIVRLIVLAPAISCAYFLLFVLRGECVIHPWLIALMASFASLYGLVASRLSRRPWLDLRTQKG